MRAFFDIVQFRIRGEWSSDREIVLVSRPKLWQQQKKHIRGRDATQFLKTVLCPAHGFCPEFCESSFIFCDSGLKNDKFSFLQAQTGKAHENTNTKAHRHRHTNTQTHPHILRNTHAHIHIHMHKFVRKTNTNTSTCTHMYTHNYTCSAAALLPKSTQNYKQLMTRNSTNMI